MLQLKEQQQGKDLANVCISLSCLAKTTNKYPVVGPDYDICRHLDAVLVHLLCPCLLRILHGKSCQVTVSILDMSSIGMLQSWMCAGHM